jgi:hypothetical protein
MEKLTDYFMPHAQKQKSQGCLIQKYISFEIVFDTRKQN